MAQETRLPVTPLLASGVSWNNESNATVEDDNYASTGDNEFGTVGEYCGCDYQDPTQTPTSLDDFKVRFLDINGDHSDDTFLLQVYNNHTSAWETLETFNSGNLLPTTLTTKDYTTAMQTKFNAATDKSAFLTNLQMRIYMSAKSGGPDKPEIGLAWSKFIYSYAAAVPVDMGTVSMAGSGDTTISAGRGRGISAAPAGSGNLTATLDRLRGLIASLDATGGLTATMYRNMFLIAAIAGAGDIVSTLSRSRPIQAQIGGSGGLQATLSRSRPLTATMAGSGGLTATAGRSRPLQVQIAGSGGLTADLNEGAPGGPAPIYPTGPQVQYIPDKKVIHKEFHQTIWLYGDLVYEMKTALNLKGSLMVPVKDEIRIKGSLLQNHKQTIELKGKSKIPDRLLFWLIDN